MAATLQSIVRCQKELKVLYFVLKVNILCMSLTLLRPLFHSYRSLSIHGFLDQLADFYLKWILECNELWINTFEAIQIHTHTHTQTHTHTHAHRYIHIYIYNIIYIYIYIYIYLSLSLYIYIYNLRHENDLTPSRIATQFYFSITLYIYFSKKKKYII